MSCMGFKRIEVLVWMRLMKWLFRVIGIGSLLWGRV